VTDARRLNLSSHEVARDAGQAALTHPLSPSIGNPLLREACRNAPFLREVARTGPSLRPEEQRSGPTADGRLGAVQGMLAAPPLVSGGEGPYERNRRFP
jgi:hypothetical protein